MRKIHIDSQYVKELGQSELHTLQIRELELERDHIIETRKGSLIAIMVMGEHSDYVYVSEVVKTKEGYSNSSSELPEEMEELFQAKIDITELNAIQRDDLMNWTLSHLIEFFYSDDVQHESLPSHVVELFDMVQEW